MSRPPQFDDRDQSILDERQAAYLEREGPQVGHWVRFADGVLRRISHVWDWGEPDKVSIQTSDGGSFYLGKWYMNFSGGLYPGVPATTFRPTDELKPAPAWFFHHDYCQAHNGVHVQVPCPVWECTQPAND